MMFKEQDNNMPAAQKEAYDLNLTKISVKMITTSSFLLNANGHFNQTFQFGETISGIKAVLLATTPNAAWVFGNVQEWNSSQATCGFFNSAPMSISGTATLAVFYTA